MKPYIAYLRSNLKLTSRDRAVLFFNYLFPLIFFLAFGEGFGAATSPGAMSQVLAMVLMIGVLGSGFFGAGMRAVIDRESGILRRFKVAPITPGPIVISGLITGWILFMPTVALFVALGHYRYHAPWPAHPLDFFLMISLGALAFRAIGMIIGSVVNSMGESQIIIQLLYLPNLMLSGATVPLSTMPTWLQTVAEFLPGKHLYLGLQGVLVRGERLGDNLQVLGAMTLASIVGVFISVQVFRWEKEEKLKPAAKLWVAGVLLPFLLLGSWQAYSKENLRKTERLAREMRRSQSWLIKDARIFTGDGTVIEQGAVLVRLGKIEQVFAGTAPDAKSLNAEAIEASGKTVLPGLIDAGVTMFMPGTGAPETRSEKLLKVLERESAAYLYCGVVGVRTQPDPMGLIPSLQKRVDVGEVLGSELFVATSPVSPASLSVAEAAAGGTAHLKDSLLQQVVKPADLQKLRAIAQGRAASTVELPPPPMALAPASGAGALLLPHGPGLHHELQLWVKAGVSPAQALQAATQGAARLVGAEHRLGLIKHGYDASLLIVEGNPLEDISATARVWSVLFKGERVRRDDLFDKDAKN